MTDVSAFYDDLAEHYDEIYADWPAAVRRQGASLARLIRERATGEAISVFDCTCGIGTQAIGLALEGFDVRGADLSPRAIARARTESANFGASIQFVVGDVRDLATAEGQFDVVLSADNSLPHLLTDVDLDRALSRMATRTRPDGLIMIGIRDYAPLRESRPTSTMPSVIDDARGRRISFQTWDWAPDGATYTVSQFLLRADRQRPDTWRTHSARTRYRALTRAELEAAVSRAGPRDVAWHEPETTGHHQPLLTAHRPE